MWAGERNLDVVKIQMTFKSLDESIGWEHTDGEEKGTKHRP